MPSRTWLATLFPVLLVAPSCAQELDTALLQQAPVTPTPPVTAADTVAALALERAVRFPLEGPGTLVYAGGRRVVVATDHEVIDVYSLSSHAVPVVDSVGFLLMKRVQIQELANKYSSLHYSQIISVSVQGDTAIVSIFSATLRSEAEGPFLGHGSSCNWRFVWAAGGWSFDKQLGCLT